MGKTIELIALIFKSEDYLDLIVNEFRSVRTIADGWDVSLRIVANDATPEIIAKLDELKESNTLKKEIKVSIYNDPKPNDYYLNRVYRCWNYAGQTCQADNLCFINSDMVFSDNWLGNLLKHHDGVNIPCSRLVESGKMRSGTYGISYDFGRNPKNIDTEGWITAANEWSQDMVKDGGLYMPCVFEKKRFIESGMYPEGNIYTDGVGTLNGFVQSGDDWFFKKLNKEYGMKHITVFDSLVYHIQEGEKDA